MNCIDTLPAVRLAVVSGVVAAPATAAPVVHSLSDDSLDRSGRLVISGSGFGEDGGQLLIGGHAAIVTQWDDTRIVGYVPESAGPGSEPVVVLTGTETSAPALLEVTLRAAEGRVRWRFEIDGDYTTHRPGVGADGRVYVNDVHGRLYALSSAGGLLWAVDALLGLVGNGAEGATAVGADGSLYVAMNPLGPAVHITSFDADGGLRWVHSATGQTIHAGPTIGPDGNVYFAIDASSGPDVVSLTPDGEIRWAVHASPSVLEHGGVGAEMAFAPGVAGGAADTLLLNADLHGQGRNYGFALKDGSPVFSVEVGGLNDLMQQYQTQLAGGGVEAAFYMTEFLANGPGWGLQAFSVADGSRLWRFDPGIFSGASAPFVGSDGSVYFSWDSGRVALVSPSGAELWRHTGAGVYGDGPVVDGADRTLVICGRVAFGAPGFVQALDASTGSALWRVDLPQEADGGQVVPDGRVSFAPGGATVFVPTLVLAGPDNDEYAYLYALDAITADLDGDGAVGGSDLAILLGDWGLEDSPADLDGDSVVGGADLAILLGLWST